MAGKAGVLGGNEEVLVVEEGSCRGNHELEVGIDDGYLERSDTACFSNDEPTETMYEG